MRKTPEDTFKKAFRFVRLPYPKTWIEITHSSDKEGVGKYESTIGYLLQEIAPGVISFEECARQGFVDDEVRAMPMPGGKILGGIITEDGIRINQNDLSRNITPEEFIASNMTDEYITDLGKQYTMREILSVLLLLNSRSQIIKPGQRSEEYTKFNKSRGKKGKLPFAEFSPIQFDISRTLRKSSRPQDDQDAISAMAESLIVGHFKVRQSGIYWWSAHLRNKRPDVDEATAMAEQLNRPRDTHMSKSDQVHYAPNATPVYKPPKKTMP